MRDKNIGYSTADCLYTFEEILDIWFCIVYYADRRLSGSLLIPQFCQDEFTELYVHFYNKTECSK